MLIVVGVAGCLGLLFVFGIIAAIAVPNLLNAIDRGKQKRTMADILAIATAIEQYEIDQEFYPRADDVAQLGSLLVPRYLRAVPESDGWGHRLRVASAPAGYELVSPGKDGVLQGCDGGESDRFTADICYADGGFTQWPGGMQH